MCMVGHVGHSVVVVNTVVGDAVVALAPRWLHFPQGVCLRHSHYDVLSNYDNLILLTFNTLQRVLIHGQT